MPAVPKLVKEGARAKLTAAPNLRMVSPQSAATWGWGPEADSDRACFQGLRAVWPQGLSFLIWKMGSLTQQPLPLTDRKPGLTTAQVTTSVRLSTAGLFLRMWSWVSKGNTFQSHTLNRKIT